jgi:diamine N-acetyltransferase
VIVRPATAADAPALAALAAITFPLACPPHTSDAAKASFIAQHLSEQSFAAYLADDARALFVAEEDSGAEAFVGYTMLVFGEPADQDVAGAIRHRPSCELSKCYVHPDAHGTGVASALMERSLEAAAAGGADGVWLGVNEENAKAQRFYAKHGFARVGTKHFQVGNRLEDDWVMERTLDR